MLSGQSSALSWSVSNATSLSINNGIGVVTGRTSITVNPAQATTYILTATNNSGSVTAQVSIGVFTCDLNGDGVINNADVTLAAGMALGTTPIDRRADLDQDGRVTIVDVQHIINATLGGGCRISP